MKNEIEPETKWQHGAVFENKNGLLWDEVSFDSEPDKKEPAVIIRNVSPK
jgi:hypothetical protein